MNNRKKGKKMKKILLAFALCFPIYANATPVTWLLEDMRIGFYTISAPGGPFSHDFTTTLTGSFVYDADSDVYSDLDITANGGSALHCISSSGSTCTGATITSMPTTHYDFAANTSTFTTSSSLVSLVASQVGDGLFGDPILFFKFASDLTNAGGVIDITPSTIEFICQTTASCEFDVTKDTYRYVVASDVLDSAGHVVITGGKIVSVPEPASLALMMIGGLILALRRRQPREFSGTGVRLFAY
jgi:hypothetical protein